LKKLILAGIILSLALIIETFLFEWVLNATSRKFMKEMIRPTRGIALFVAVRTFNVPRLYRSKSEYEDIHALIFTLLHINDNVEDASWGIRSAINIINDNLGKYSSDSEEYFYLLQRKIGILNRSPLPISNFIKIGNDVDLLITLSDRDGSKIQKIQKAYAHVERVLYLANSGGNEKEIDVSYKEALRILDNDYSPENGLNTTKFGYYYGYAKCLVGNGEGGKLMVSSLNELSKKSANFHEAMTLNWDWTLVGNLASQKSRGHVACGNYVNEMKKYLYN
jgi:hypothetical protein